jgi:hypothetical protein
MRALLAPRAFLPRPVNRRDVTSRSAGDGEHAYDDPVDRALAVFWRNWTGNASCRHLVTASPRGSLWRSPEEIESRVRAWLDVFPPSPSGTCGAHGIDVPTIGTREPMTLLLTKAEAARAVVRAKTTLECGGRQITLAPGVLLIDEEKLGRAVRALREEVGETEAREIIRTEPDAALTLAGWWDEDGEEGGEGGRRDSLRTRKHYARAMPPVGAVAAVRERIAERERGAKKIRVGVDERTAGAG